MGKLLKPRNFFLRKAWEICSVSIAAQIGTLPLTLYYFNRFPPWFLLGNLLLIPLVTVIMVVFTVMLLFIFSPFFFALILKLELFLSGLMNRSVRFVESLPSPKADAIFITPLQLILISGIILSFSFYLRHRKNSLLILSLGLLSVLTVAGTAAKFSRMKNAEALIFSVPGNTMIGFCSGSSSRLCYGKDSSAGINALYSFHCKSWFMAEGAADPEIMTFKSLPETDRAVPLPGNDNILFSFRKKKILILSDPDYFRGKFSRIPLRADIILVNDRVPEAVKGRNPLFVTRCLVVGSGMPVYRAIQNNDRLTVSCDSIADIRKTGAYRF